MPMNHKSKWPGGRGKPKDMRVSDGYTVEKGHGGMKRNRHDPQMSSLYPMSPVEPPDPFGVGPSTRNRQQDREFAKEMGESKRRTARKKKARKVAQVASKAASDMSQSMAEDQARFSAEHDQAVAEGRAMQQRNMQGSPGRAQDIIKRRRV